MAKTLKALPKEWFARDAVEIAPKLLGKIIRYEECEGIIVETEAYTTDSASHAKNITPRSQILKDTYAHWYVYFTYGMHYCANVTTNKDSVGAVLIRAVEPTRGLEIMRDRRIGPKGTYVPDKLLCAGPGRLCQAFSITKAENGLPIAKDFTIYDAPELPAAEIGSSSRIGISSAQELQWRFYVKGNAYVSRPSK